MTVFIYHENIRNHFIYTNMIDYSYNINIFCVDVLINSFGTVNQNCMMRFCEVSFSYVDKLTDEADDSEAEVTCLWVTWSLDLNVSHSRDRETKPGA